MPGTANAGVPAPELAAADLLEGRTSLTGRHWIERKADTRDAMALAQRLNVPEAVGRALSARAIGLDEAEGFLSPKLKTELPDPDILKDMDKAAPRLAQAVMNGEKIAVFGDYDVDGATSSALLKSFLEAAGATVVVYIPDRQKEGYGPNTDALLKLKADGAALVVTVDCGTAAFEPLEKATDAGLDVIVIDHHEAETRLPKAVAVVNPKRLDESTTTTHACAHMAAVGVAFLVAVAVNRVLRDAGWYKTERAEPDLMNWLDIVALGTVCDVVALTGVNRALVHQGLKVLAKRRNLGLRALSDVTGINEAPTAYHLGFVLGPRINAGGRVGESSLGSRLLTTRDGAEAEKIARQLHDLNRERQDIEARVLEAALLQVEGKIAMAADATPPAFILAAGEGWHPGVVGIVASRLKERFNRPAAVVSLKDGVGTGSARSVAGADMGSAVIAANHEGLTLKGGGHAMAAGFSVNADKLAELEAFITARMQTALGENPPPPGLYLDAMLSLGGANLAMVEALEKLSPFGIGNAEPRFAVKDVRFVEARAVGADQSHVRFVMANDAGARLTGIAFRAQDSDLGPGLLAHGGKPFHVAGKLRVNEWQGRRSAQLIVEDAVPAW